MLKTAIWLEKCLQPIDLKMLTTVSSEKTANHDRYYNKYTIFYKSLYVITAIRTLNESV